MLRHAETKTLFQKKTNRVLAQRKIMIIGPDQVSRGFFASSFRNFGCEVVVARAPEEVMAAIQLGEKIEMVLLDVDGSVTKVLDIVRKFRAAGPSAPSIFLACDQPVDENLHEAFFEGVEAAFTKPVKAADLEKGAAYAYAEAFRSADMDFRKHERMRLCRARVTYDTVNASSMAGYATNFCLGGMFVGSMQAMPESGSKIEFSMEIDGMELSGAGTARWTRPTIEYGRPRGFGVEFAGLEPAMQKKLRQLLGWTSAAKPAG